jgi:hypothetical protein
MRKLILFAILVCVGLFAFAPIASADVFYFRDGLGNLVGQDTCTGETFIASVTAPVYNYRYTYNSARFFDPRFSVGVGSNTIIVDRGRFFDPRIEFRGGFRDPFFPRAVPFRSAAFIRGPGVDIRVR